MLVVTDNAPAALWGCKVLGAWLAAVAPLVAVLRIVVVAADMLVVDTPEE